MKDSELEVYAKEASTWWDSDSRMAGLNRFNPPRFGYFDKFITTWVGKEVLDVGCGGGFTSEVLATKGAIVHGIDILSELIKVAQKHATEMSLSIDYRQSAAEKLPFDDASFDAVLCVDVLEHVSDVQQVLSEIKRVLKKNGLLFFDTINKTPASKYVIITLYEEIMKTVSKGSHDWNKFIEPERLHSLLQKIGFGDVEMKGFNRIGEDSSTGAPIFEINEKMDVFYIGKAVSNSA